MDSFHDLKGRLQRGDGTAAEEIFRRYAQQLIRMAAPKLVGAIRQKIDPEDLVQSAFKSFFRVQAAEPFTMEGWSDLWAILATLTLRKCRFQVRHFLTLKRHVTKELPLQPDSASQWQAVAEAPSPLEVVSLEDLVQHWLGHLEGSSRKIAELALEGWSAREIAGEINLTERTVHRQMRLVREKLLELDDFKE